jgi:Putative Flp pilus-assembly TadE/G-like
MRPLTRPFAGDDRGAVLIWVAASLVALVGMGAMVVDVGALYAERRELQNGADAAALAVAKDCAEGNCSGSGAYGADEYGTADNFADENANDGMSDVPLVCGDDGPAPVLAACVEPPDAVPDEASGWVRVDTSTRNEGGNQIEFVLAPVLDAANVGQRVEATAIAAWGPAGSATTIPLIFSLCEFNNDGGSLDDGAPLPTGEKFIYFHDTSEAGPPCDPSHSGAQLPGGFGWLPRDEDCKVDIEVGEPVPAYTGANKLQNCDPVTWRNAEVAIPLFDEISESPKQYQVVGFAGFKITGYNFSGNQNDWGMDRCLEGNGESTVCIRGEFTRVTATGGFGDGGNFGVSVVTMIG